MTPVRPPATKMASAPVTNSMGTEKITRPSSMVAMKEKICTPVGIDTASEAAEKKPSEMLGRQVARSEEHTTELQSLTRTTYDDFSLQNKTNTIMSAHTQL